MPAVHHFGEVRHAEDDRTLDELRAVDTAGHGAAERALGEEGSGTAVSAGRLKG